MKHDPYKQNDHLQDSISKQITAKSLHKQRILNQNLYNDINYCENSEE